MLRPRTTRSIFSSALLVVLLCLTAIVVPAASADELRIDQDTIQLASDLTAINHGQTVSNVEYGCPSDFPFWGGEWTNSSTGAQSTLLGPIGVSAVLTPLALISNMVAGVKPSFTFTDWAATGDQRYGVTLTCRRYATLADCGAEGQRVCWGAVRSDGGAADQMFQVLGALNCDRGLVIDVKNFLGDKNTCKDSTRHVLQNAEADAASHATRVLDEQAYQLAADEPMNLVVRPATHESYNDRNDNYSFPNQEYSLSDQLDAGVRYLDLRARDALPITPYMRMSHGTNACLGCAATDRPLNYAIEEIGQWLAKNPEQVIMFRVAQYSDNETTNDQDYVIDPIAKYLGNRVLGPMEWCQYLATHQSGVPLRLDGQLVPVPAHCTSLSGAQIGNGWQPYRWPTLAEMRDPANWACNCVKQAIIAISGDQHFQHGTWLFDVDFAGSGTGSSDARDFDPSTCSRGGVKYDLASVSKQDFFSNWTTESEARVVGQAVATHDKSGADRWPGYIYAMHSDIPTSAPLINGVTTARPYANEGTSIEDLLNCNIAATLDMYMADQYYNGDMIDVPPDHLRRDAMVWTWKNDDDLQANKCAMLGWTDDAFHARDCGERHTVVCALPSTPATAVFRAGDAWNWQDPMGMNWRVTTGQYTFASAPQGCQTEFPGWVFGVPTNKYMENQLQAANLQHQDLWLAYTNNVSGGAPAWKKWTVARMPSITMNDFRVAHGSTTTLQVGNAGVPLAQLSPRWQWQVNAQTVSAGGATAQFSATDIPAGSAVPVQLMLTDASGLSSTASATVYVTPGGFTPLDVRAFSYGSAHTVPGFIHGATGHTLSVTPSGKGTLTLGLLRNAGVAMPSGIGTGATFYSAAISPDSGFASLAFTACDAGMNLVMQYDAAAASWSAVPEQKYDPLTGCINFTAAPLSGVHLDRLNGLVFGFANDKTAPWTRVFFKTADHVAYLPGHVASQDVEVIIMADDGFGSGVASVAYKLTTPNVPGAPAISGSLSPNSSFWLTANGTYTLTYTAMDYRGNATATQTIANITIQK